MKPDLILSADWHLREDQPECRTDDYRLAQSKAVQFICRLTEKWKCPLVIAGDLFDKWNPSLFLTNWTLLNLPMVPIYCVAGQHDLRNHRISSLPETGVNLLESAKRVYILKTGRTLDIQRSGEDMGTISGYSWEETPQGRSRREDLRGWRAAVIHKLVWNRKKPFPQVSQQDQACRLLEDLYGYDLVVTGDNHQPFVLKTENSILVNPGSLLRMRANQINHKPRVYLWYAKERKVEKVFLPIEEGVVSREHIEKKEEENQRLESFVRKLSEQGEVSLSFADKMERFFRKDRTPKPVRKLIREAMNE